MTQKPACVSYPLPPEGVELLKQYRQLMNDLHDTCDMIQERAQKEANELHSKTMEEAKLLWIKMAAMINIDAESTWASNDWGVDSRYVDHGFGVINNVTIGHMRPPMSMGMHQPTPDDEEGPPPGSTLN